jgi:hypothetical protein
MRAVADAMRRRVDLLVFVRRKRPVALEAKVDAIAGDVDARYPQGGSNAGRRAAQTAVARLEMTCGKFAHPVTGPNLTVCNASRLITPVHRASGRQCTQSAAAHLLG